MTDEEFRDAVARLIDPDRCKVWLTKVNGHRLEFVFSIGSEQLKPVHTLMRDRDFILLAQCVDEELSRAIRPLFDKYMETAEPSSATSLF